MRAPRDRHVGFPVLGAFPHPSKTQAAPGGGGKRIVIIIIIPPRLRVIPSLLDPAAGLVPAARGRTATTAAWGSLQLWRGFPGAGPTVSRSRPYKDPGAGSVLLGAAPPQGDGTGRAGMRSPSFFHPILPRPSPEHPPGSPQRAAPGGFAAPPPCCRASSPPSSPRRPPGSFLSSPLAPPIVISLCPGSESSAAGCGSLPNRLPAAWAGVEGPGASGSILKLSVSVARRALL